MIVSSVDSDWRSGSVSILILDFRFLILYDG
jgi:hypothetical protein